jgi:hypothetical protein
MQLARRSNANNANRWESLYLRLFELFEDDGQLAKKTVGYHQFHAVRFAIGQVVNASRPGGSQKGGVVCHTQGSGKSITMTCFAARLMREALSKATFVALAVHRYRVKTATPARCLGTTSTSMACSRPRKMARP